jgi:crotonobetainyl-CoA:carnitine CoA-transferase CaiB-like acyl-CoA transferase
LIYCSITGYGETGAWKDRPAYDIALQAEAGLMSITGNEGGEPVRVGVAVIDIVTGQYLVQAILAALLARQRAGTGQRIDLAMLDCGVAFLTYMGQFYFATGTSPRGMGSRHPTISPYQALPTKDSFVVFAVGSQEIWARFCRAIGQPELTDDGRFRDNAHRVENREALEGLLTATFRTRTTAEWLDILRRHQVPATPVNDLRAVFELEPVKEREMIHHVPHPTIGELLTINSPLRFEKTPVAIRQAPPLLGQHTEEILQELGYERHEISLLQEQGVI